jgi:hypothetical protein
MVLIHDMIYLFNVVVHYTLTQNNTQNNTMNHTIQDITYITIRIHKHNNKNT